MLIHLLFTGGESKNVPELHNDHFEEYRLLTDEQKDEYVEQFKERHTRDLKLRRDTPRAKIQDVANIVRNMKLLVCPVLHFEVPWLMDAADGWPRQSCRSRGIFLRRQKQRRLSHAATVVFYLTRARAVHGYRNAQEMDNGGGGNQNRGIRCRGLRRHECVLIVC